MRILYHAINGSGLGHLTRLGAIAAAVQDEAPEVHQLVATSANYPQLLARMRIPYLILPRDASGPFLTTDRRRHSVAGDVADRILRETIRAYDPRVVVFDTHAPRALVDDCVEHGRQAVLVLRQCRDELMARMLRDGSLEPFATILLPHTRAHMQAILPAALLDRLEALDKVEYVGGIAFPAAIDAAAVAAVSARYALPPTTKLLLLCAGSGGYTAVNQRFIEAGCRALAAIADANQQLQAICIAGPYAAHLPQLAGCRVVQSEPDLQALMMRADLVIAHAGYNTVQEVLRTGVRAVLVPTYRRSEDQGALVLALLPRPGMLIVEADAPAVEFQAACETLLQAAGPVPEPSLGAAHAARKILQAGAIPDFYICGDAGPGHAVSPGEAARAITSSTREARLRIDWDRALMLFDTLDDAMRRRLISIQIDLGAGDPDELTERAAAVYDLLISAAIDPRRITFTLRDDMSGATLALLAKNIAALEFSTLVAQVPKLHLSNAAEEIFAAMEFCRGLPLRFSVDVTELENPVAFIDQH